MAAPAMRKVRATKDNGFDLERSALCDFLRLSWLALADVLLYIWFVSFGTAFYAELWLVCSRGEAGEWYWARLFGSKHNRVQPVTPVAAGGRLALITGQGLLSASTAHR